MWDLIWEVLKNVNFVFFVYFVFVGFIGDMFVLNFFYVVKEIYIVNYVVYFLIMRLVFNNEDVELVYKNYENE